ncbi:uncharacterized protein LOC127241367 [Andrographis paniculata]|uniref:uncharacterized protein LOC127241367 n=1 Tax=Andrographis paniculata TaxID=175694 RepID=UPI0021E8A08A|nr:uncharacterized protein LOC127241367 [Andrographis paniculata]
MLLRAAPAILHQYQTPKSSFSGAINPPPSRLCSIQFHSRRIAYSPALLSYSSPMATGEATVRSSPAVINLNPIDATPETFKEFGQVIEASPDGDEFGPADAQLDLSRGIPRFYIMHIENRPLKFSTITHHASVTQCLGSIGGHTWYLGVAKPSIIDPTEGKAANAVESHCGHYYSPPVVDEVQVFRVSGPKFLKLHRGTWHAGPLFVAKAMDFYNLELSNTNVVDHTTHSFAKKNNVVFSFDE